jgi:uncharacterized OB-fold protein
VTDLARPVPVADDPDTGGFFEAAKRGAIGVLHCNGCGCVLHLPRPYCHHCGSWDVAWRDVAPRGHVYSFIVVEHGIHPAFPVPYTVLLVELSDAPGVRLIGHLEGAPELEIGDGVVAEFDDVRDGVVVPRWLLDR